MINAITLFCTFLALWLILVGINDCIELDDQATEERREAFRQEAYAEQRQLRVIKGNRESLWADISKE